MRLAGAIVIALLLSPAVAHAQTTELGTITVAVPRPLRASDFVVTARHAVPHPSITEVPVDATELLGIWAAREASVRAASRALRTVAIGPARDAASAHVVELERRLARARRELEVALEAEDAATLTRPALLLLGQLRWDDAAERYIEALDAWEACSAGGGACPEPPSIGDATAVAAWERVTGDDEIAAWAWYERAWSALEHDGGATRELLTHLVAMAAAPHVLVGDAAFALGEGIEGDDPAAAASAFTRCAAVAEPALAPHCALHAGIVLAHLGRPREALEALAPILDDAELPDAALFAGELVVRGAPLASFPDAVRARLLVAGAARWASYGFFERARDTVADARAIADDPALAVLEAGYAAPDGTLETWLRRAVAFCAAPSDLASARLGLHARVGPGGTHVFPGSQVVPAGAAEIVRCLARAPAPRVSETFRVEIQLGAP